MFCLSQILRDPRLHVSSSDPILRRLEIHIHEPQLVHQGRGVTPRRLVQREVVAFYHDDARCGRDGDVVFDGVFDRVVE